MRALACPASLKGVLGAGPAAAALARGFRAARADAVELPVADGGEGTAEVVARRARRRVETRACLGSARAASRRALAPAPGRARGRRGGGGDRASAPRAPRARPATGVEPRLRRAPGGGARSPAGLARGRARRHRHHGRRSGAPRGGGRARRPGGRALRRARHARGRRPAVRAAEGRLGRATSRSSSAGSRRWRSSVPTRRCPARAPPAASGPRSPRSARSSSPGLPPCSTCSGSTSASPAATSSSRARGSVDATTLEGKAPSEVARALRGGGRSLRRLRRSRVGRGAGRGDGGAVRRGPAQSRGTDLRRARRGGSAPGL